ncbi:MAG: prepilin peptidase [Actinomycetia bacterium]|nr:prepilin peptidase [Actinomycetes bacterium]
MPQPFFIVTLGVFGLVFGSFANVVIWRLPRGESLAAPGSHCPVCDAPIRWRDNIPVISWLVLRGKCRSCGARISPRYPLVEATSALVCVAAGTRFGLSWRALFAAALFYLLLVLSAIDIDHMRLPNPLVGVLAALGVVGVGLSVVAAVPVLPLVGLRNPYLATGPVAQAALGALLGAGITLGISAAYGALRGKQGMGMGDIKLLTTLGLFIGPYVLMALFAGSVIGALVGLAARRRVEGGLAGRIPFGPFLAMGTFFTVMWGEQALAWYLALVGLTG